MAGDMGPGAWDRGRGGLKRGRGDPHEYAPSPPLPSPAAAAIQSEAGILTSTPPALPCCSCHSVRSVRNGNSIHVPSRPPPTLSPSSPPSLQPPSPAQALRSCP